MNPVETGKEPAMPASKEFFAYAVPATISMILSAMVIIVDGFFVGRNVGPGGLAAVNLTLPVFYLFLGTAIMTGVGGSILVAHSRGAGNDSEARRHFSDSMTLLTAGAVLLTALVVLFFEPILTLIRAEGQLYEPTREYLGTIRWFYPLMMVNIGFTIFLRAEGKPAMSMMVGVLGNVLNVILNFILITGLGWGMRGAAMASGASAAVPVLVCISHFASKRTLIKFTRPRLRFGESVRMLWNGSSEMISQLSVAVSTWLFNWVILKRMGVDGLAAFTIVGYLICFEGMLITGLATGLGPVAGFHSGAGNNRRVLDVLGIALKAAFISGAVCWLVVMGLGGRIAFSMSGGSREIMDLARSGYWIFTSAFLLNGFNVIVATFLTARKKAGESALISGLRGLVLNSLCIILLPMLWGAMGVWLSFPVTEFLTLGAAAFYLSRARKELKPQTDREDCLKTA